MLSLSLAIALPLTAYILTKCTIPLFNITVTYTPPEVVPAPPVLTEQPAEQPTVFSLDSFIQNFNDLMEVNQDANNTRKP